MIGALPAPAAATPGDCEGGAGWSAAIPEPAAEVLALVNAHRAELGLAPLAVSPALTASAEWKARHMATNGYLDHVDRAPLGDRSAADRMRACGYPAQASVGENVADAFSTAASVVEAWVASDGHRLNIEGADYTATGVGVAQSATGTLYWTQDFGAPAQAIPSSPVPLPLEPRGIGARMPARNACRRARRSPRAARCRLVLRSGPVMVRAWLLREHRVLAHGSLHAGRAGAVWVRLRARRRLTPGRTVLALRVGDARLRRTVRLR